MNEKNPLVSQKIPGPKDDSKGSYYLEKKYARSFSNKNLTHQNPLIDASNQIFSIITSIQQRKKFQNIHNLRSIILKEMYSFKKKVETLKYDKKNIFVKRITSGT